MLDVTKPVRYSNYPHDPAVILTTERPTSDYPVVSMNLKTGELLSHQPNGKGLWRDLENVPDEKVVYQNLYPSSNHHPTLEKARNMATYDTIGTIKLTLTDGKVTNAEVV